MQQKQWTNANQSQKWRVLESAAYYVNRLLPEKPLSVLFAIQESEINGFSCSTDRKGVIPKSE